MARSFVPANSSALTTASGSPRPTAPLTVSAWVYPLAFDGNGFGIVQFETGSSSDGYALILNSNLAAWIVRHNDANVTVNSPNAAALNAWNHTLATDNGAADHRVRLNGGTQGTNTGGSNWAPVASIGLSVGRTVGGAGYSYFNGRIAEVGIWNVILDDKEQIALSQGVSPLLVRRHALVAYYPLISGRDPEPIISATGINLPLSLVNAPAYAPHPPVIAPQLARLGLLIPPGPPAPVYVGPPNGATNLPLPQSLSWAASEGATSYEVYYGTSSTPPLVSTQTALTYTPPAQTLGTTYYWQVGARNANGIAFGPIWSFTINTLPAAPTYVSPANGAIDLAAPQTLSWNAAAGATSYDVYLGVGPTPPLVTNQPGLTYTPPSLVVGATYTWQIVARNNVGTAAGPVWTFTMGAPPAIPVNFSPLNYATNVAVSTGISWVVDPAATSYTVRFGPTDPPPVVATGLTVGHYDPIDLDLGTRYYWQVEAVNPFGSTRGPVWQFVVTNAPLYADMALDVALGGSFRRWLVTAHEGVALYPLNDFSGTRMTEIGGRALHGTWVGSGLVTAVPFDLPEGGLGVRLNGNQYGTVPDDPFLSLAFGDLEFVCLLRDLTIDAARRCIVCKQDGTGGPTANGWYLAVQNGRIETYLRVSGTLVYQVQSATVLQPNREYLITTRYDQPDAGGGLVEITIDGVLDTSVTYPANTQPNYTTGPVRIGAFTNGVAGDGAGFKGSLAYVLLGRGAGEHTGELLQATRAWTEITTHVRSVPTPMQLRTGIAGVGPTDHVATTGTLQFLLDNSDRKWATGGYTPSHQNVRPGWEIGVPIRWRLIGPQKQTYYAFRGRLMQVEPLPGVRQAKYVDCQATDWLDVAAGTPVGAVPPQQDKSSDYVLKVVLEQAQGRVPVALDIHPGAGVFPYALDSGASERDTLLTELARVVTSEDGYLTIRGDTVRGGVLTFVAHGERLTTPLIAGFDHTMTGLQVTYSLERLINIVRVTYTPRRVGTAAATLYTLDISDEPQIVPKGETRVFEGGYVSPTQEGDGIGGINLIAMVAGTDYAFTANADGTGGSLLANLKLTQTLGGNSFRVEFQNTGATDGYLRLNATTAFQIRGTPVYHYKPITIERRDSDSVRERGPRALAIDLPYETRAAVATSIAEYYLALYDRETPVPSSVTVNLNRSTRLMRAGLEIQPGDKIALAELMTGLHAPAEYIVHEKRLSYAAPGILFATFAVAPAPVAITLAMDRSQSGSA